MLAFMDVFKQDLGIRWGGVGWDGWWGDGGFEA